MNSLKTLFVSAVLVAVLYGVYYAMNQAPRAEPPLEVAAAWNGETSADTGIAMRAPSVETGRQVQLKAPSAAAAPPNITLPVAGTNKQTTAPPMTMNFNVPGDVPGANPSTPPPAPASRTMQNAPPVVQASAIADVDSRAIPPIQAVPKRPTVEKTLQPSMAAPTQTQPESQQPQGFDAFMAVVRGELDRGRLLDAYRMLSLRYNDPQFTPEQHALAAHLLDRLAATVVYSRHHIIEQPHRVGANETLEQISRRYNVPAELLAKINGIAPSQQPQPGSELKVVRGPFNAQIDLKKCELTLTLPDGCYAGRFAVGVGREVPVINKTYRVFDKIESPLDTGVTQAGYIAEPPRKQKWIGLEGRLGIHTAANPADVGRNGGQGGITLRDRDANDLYDILSVGSRVEIRR